MALPLVRVGQTLQQAQDNVNQNQTSNQGLKLFRVGEDNKAFLEYARWIAEQRKRQEEERLRQEEERKRLANTPAYTSKSGQNLSQNQLNNQFFTQPKNFQELAHTGRDTSPQVSNEPGLLGQMKNAFLQGAANAEKNLFTTMTKISEKLAPNSKISQLMKNAEKGYQEILDEHPEWNAPEGTKWYSVTGIARAVTGTVPFMLMSAASEVVGNIILPGAGAGAAFSVTYTTEYGAAYNEAIALGATEEQAKKAAQRTGIINGIIEALPLEMITLGLWDLPEKFVFKKIRSSTAKYAASVSKKILTTAATEGAEEALQEFVGNFFAKKYYDEDRKLTDGVVEAYVLGTITGGILAGGTHTIEALTSKRKEFIKQAKKEGISEEKAAAYFDEMIDDINQQQKQKSQEQEEQAKQQVEQQVEQQTDQPKTFEETQPLQEPKPFQAIQEQEITQKQQAQQVKQVQQAQQVKQVQQAQQVKQVQQAQQVQNQQVIQPTQKQEIKQQPTQSTNQQQKAEIEPIKQEITPNQNSLIQEAQKYKTVDEFIKSQGRDTPQQIEANKKKILKENQEYAKIVKGKKTDFFGEKITKQTARDNLNFNNISLKKLEMNATKTQKLIDIWNQAHQKQAQISDEKQGISAKQEVKPRKIVKQPVRVIGQAQPKVETKSQTKPKQKPKVKQDTKQAKQIEKPTKKLFSTKAEIEAKKQEIDPYEKPAFLRKEEIDKMKEKQIKVLQTKQENTKNNQNKIKKNNTGKFSEKIINTEKNAVERYTRTGYNSINKAIRENKEKSLSLHDKNVIELLDKVIEKYDLKKEIIVYRGAYGHEVEFYADKKIGDKIVFPAFTSTSFSEDFAKDFVAIARKDRRALIELKVPSGKGRGADITQIQSYRASEQEFLLKRGTEFIITEKGTTSYKGEEFLLVKGEIYDKSKGVQAEQNGSFKQLQKKIDNGNRSETSGETIKDRTTRALKKETKGLKQRINEIKETKKLQAKESPILKGLEKIKAEKGVSLHLWKTEGKVVNFEIKTTKVEIQKAIKFIEKNPKQALEITLGIRENTTGINSTMLSSVMKETLKNAGEHSLAKDVATQQSLNITRSAQDVSFAQNDFRPQEEPLIASIEKAKFEELAKKEGIRNKKNAREVVDKIVKEKVETLEKKVNKEISNTEVNMQALDSWLQSILC